MKTTAKNEFNADSILNSVFNDVKNPGNAVAVMEMLDRFGLNWQVKKTPLVLPNGTETDFFGIVRQDTQKCFTTCKDSYVPFQNNELAEMLIRISEKTGYNIHGGGLFKGGAKVFLQLESPNKITGIGQNRDTVNGYLTGLNSHDGTTSLKWGETNITVSCQNTFFRALNELKQYARHTASIHAQVEMAINTLNGVVEAEKSMFDKFIKLAEVPVTKNAIAQVVKKITDIDILQPIEERVASGYAVNRCEELLACITSEMKQKGDTMWGLMSGVTNYTTHVLPVPNREHARLESLYSNKGFRTNNRVFDIVKEYAN